MALFFFDLLKKLKLENMVFFDIFFGCWTEIVIIRLLIVLDQKSGYRQTRLTTLNHLQMTAKPKVKGNGHFWSPLTLSGQNLLKIASFSH